MGYGKFKLSKVRYWKIYGDPEVSDIVCNKFLEDRNTMKHIIEFNSLDELKNVI